MTQSAKEFAKRWADENMHPTERLSDVQVAAKVQQMLNAATGERVRPEDIIDAVGSPFDFLNARNSPGRSSQSSAKNR